MDAAVLKYLPVLQVNHCIGKLRFLQVSYTLRTDKVKEHEETSDHLNAITLELEKENTQKCSESYNKDSHKAIADAVKVLYNNLSLDIFSNLVDLVIELGGQNFFFFLSQIILLH